MTVLAPSITSLTNPRVKAAVRLRDRHERDEAGLTIVDGAGADALLAADARTDLFNPNAIRASVGTIFSIPLAAGTSADVLSWLVARAITPIAARVDAQTLYSDVDLRGPVAIVLGSEA